MEGDAIARVRSHPKFAELIEKRTRYGWTLAIVMLAIYYGFILIIAFVPQLLGVLIILAAFVLTGLYVRRANSEFDALVRDILEAVK